MSSGKHILIAGTTRYGKSNLLNVIITYMLYAYTDKLVQFNLIDLKHGVEFNDYQTFPQVINIADNSRDAQLIFTELTKEHKKRMEIVKKAEQKNIEGLNIPYIITVIDEYAAINKDCKEDIELLLQQGGASGLYFILATQYPRNDVVDKLITVNCDVRISLRVKEPTASRVVLGNELAYHLKAIPGRAVYQYGEDIELQIPYLENEQHKKLLKERMEQLAHKKSVPESREFQGVIL